MNNFTAFISAFVVAMIMVCAKAFSQHDDIVWQIPSTIYMQSMAISPDGKKLYVTDYNIAAHTPIINERNTSNGKINRELFKFDLLPGSSYRKKIGISDNGRYLAIICMDRTDKSLPIIVYDCELDTMKYLRLKDTSLMRFGFNDFAISHDSKKIMGLCNYWSPYKFNNYIIEFDLETGDSLFYQSFNSNSQEDSTYSLYKIEYAPDDQNYVALGFITEYDWHKSLWTNNLKGLFVWDEKTHQRIKYFPFNYQEGANVENDAHKMLKFSKARGLLAIGFEDNLKFYNYHTWDTVEYNLDYPYGNIYSSFCFSSDGNKILETHYSHDSSRFVSNLLLITPRVNLREYTTSPIHYQFFSPDDKSFYSLSGYWLMKINTLGTSDIPAAIQSNETMKIYPNPANDFLNIEIGLDNPENCEIFLSNILNEKVKQIYSGIINGKYVQHMGTDELSPGIYFINLCTDKKTITKEIVVNK